MRLGDPVRLMRWSRWGILLTTLLIGSAIVLSAWSSHVRVHDIAWTLIRGQGQLLVDGVRQGLHETGAPSTPRGTERLLNSLKGQGLTYLALLHHEATTEAGLPLGGPPKADYVPEGSEPKVDLMEAGSRIRMVSRVPPPPPPPNLEQPPGQPPPPPPPPWEGSGGPPPPGGPPPGGPPPGGPPPGGPPPGGQPPPGARQPRPPSVELPPMVLEFEPVMARELQASSRRALLFNVLVALAMQVAAGAAFRWLKRREELEHKLARERHLALLGEMSTVLAHELRNPLASLKGHAQLLIEALPEGRSRLKAERVVKEALRLEQLTSSLLDFVRTGTIHREQTDPSAIVRAAAEEVDPQRIEVDARTAPPLCFLDAARMQQVLSNLLRNAVQASPAGTPVFARIAADEKSLLYEVRDVGTGIPPGQEAAIFEPFHTNRPLGNGLGLAVARRVVELHGGSIQASNHPEGGALFCVRIPLRA